MSLKNKKYIFITLNKNMYNRQKYIIDILNKELDIDIFFLEDLFKNYWFFYIEGPYINSFWPDSYSFYYIIFKNIFLENILPLNYSWLIITYDWSASMKRVVEIFREYNIPSFNILHEWFYLNIKDWYNMKKYTPIKLILKTNKNLNIPCSDYSYVWWNIHKNEFINRWYKWKIESIWTFKFEKYKNLKINKKELINKLKINIYNWEKIFLYVFQIIEESKIKYQYEIINDLIEYCKKKKNILLIRNQLWYNLDISKININNNVYIDWINNYLITAEESILLSDSIFAINSTMLLEWIINDKKSFSFKYFDFDSDIFTEKTISIIKNKNEIEDKINNYKINNDNIKKKLILNWDIELLLKSINNNSVNNNYKKINLNKKYYLKYFYLLFNPFLIKNLTQSFFVYIRIKLWKKY